MATGVDQKSELPIKGMTCASCVVHVAGALKDVPGVQDATVNLVTEKATVDLAGADEVGLGKLIYAVEDAGFLQ